MKKLFLLLFLFLGCTPDKLVKAKNPECGQPCYTGESRFAGVGECKYGTYICENEEIIGCEGSVYPKAEICDNLDNNCNGIIDEAVFQNCVGQCGDGRKICKSGTWSECITKLPKPEICNGEDDDCDGLIDEPEELPLEFCYDSPIETLGKGLCRPGIYRCIYGYKKCDHIGPAPEICDGQDNDCDGKVDNGTGSGKPADVVYAIDTSCSMPDSGLSLRNLNSAISNANLQINNGLRTALVGFTDNRWEYDGKPFLSFDFSEPSYFAQNVNNYVSLVKGGYQEASLDTIYYIANPGNPLKLSWQSSRRYLLIFTDEKSQTFTNPPLSEDQVAQMSQIGGLKVHVWTLKSVSDTFQKITAASGGAIHNLSGSDEQITKEIIEAISDCN